MKHPYSCERHRKIRRSRFSIVHEGLRVWSVYREGTWIGAVVQESDGRFRPSRYGGLIGPATANAHAAFAYVAGLGPAGGGA